MSRSLKFASTAVTTAIVVAFAATGPAMAAKFCKAPLTAKGMFYTTKAKAKESARYRWGLKAASVHGPAWALAGKAKQKTYKCTSGHGKKGNLINCELTGRPCMTKVICKGTVKAKGMFYTGRPKAVDSSKYRWGLAASAKYGPAFAHWNKAKSKRMKCSVKMKNGRKIFNCEATGKACK